MEGVDEVLMAETVLEVAVAVVLVLQSWEFPVV
jgi:hypothetical protein